MSCTAAPRVILTRPAPQAADWASALTEAGFEVESLALINIQLLPAPTTLPDLAQIDAVFLVSRNALDGLVAWLGAPALLAAATRFLCPGAGTAQALLHLGVAASRIVQPPTETAQDSEHLWQHLQNSQPLPAGSRLLVVKGCDTPSMPASPNWLGQQAANIGVQVASVDSYERSAPELTVAQAELAQAAAQDGSVWIFSSSQAIANLVAALPEQRWTGTPCIATHPRIAQSAAAHGFAAQICQPRLNDMAHALHQLAAATN